MDNNVKYYEGVRAQHFWELAYDGLRRRLKSPVGRWHWPLTYSIDMSVKGQPLAPSPERLQHFVETGIRFGFWLGSRDENASIGIIF
jgi:hypothetical protein